MPSGSKKRKSSKKKKKLGGNNNNNNNNNNVPQVSRSAIAVNSHSHGKEDLKHGGKKETDGRDVSYSASQDHQFNDREGTREKQSEIPHSESSIDKNKSNALKGRNEANKVAMVEGGIVQVERELKLEGESMRNNINIERVEPGKFPHEGGLRRRSSNSNKPAMSEDIVQVATSASDVDDVAFESSEKENEKRELGVMVEKTRTSNVVVDKGLVKRDNEAVATSNAKPSVPVKDADKLGIPYDAPTVDAGVRANDMEGSPHDHQPLVALGPRPVQTTSWRSCCGLFEVFAGSNR